MPKAKTFTLLGREPDRARKRAVGTKRLQGGGEFGLNEYFQPLKREKIERQADYACLWDEKKRSSLKSSVLR